MALADKQWLLREGRGKGTPGPTASLRGSGAYVWLSGWGQQVSFMLQVVSQCVYVCVSVRPSWHLLWGFPLLTKQVTKTLRDICLQGHLSCCV